MSDVKNYNKYKNTLSLVLMMVISCITQVLTLMKSSMVAGIFGLSQEMDAYNLSNSIVSFIFGLIAGGIPTIIIPCYVNKIKSKYTNSFITIIYGSLAVISILTIILRYRVVCLISNRNEAFVSTACSVLIVLLFSQYLFSITNITTAYFQCCEKYNIPKIINLLSQVLVVSVLAFLKDITIYQYALIISIGVLINFIFDIVLAIKNGWSFKPQFAFRHPEVKKLLSQFFPILFSSSIFKLSLFIDSTIASRLEEGKLTVLSYSNQITSIINSVIIGNLLIYAYPKIVKNIKLNSNQTRFWGQVHLFHSIICLVVSGFVSVGKEGISILFQHGSFDEKAVKYVYIGAMIYIFGQQHNVIRDLIYRYFYAKGDTKTASLNSVLVSIVNITISLILVKVIGFYGIILGTIIASFVSLVVILFRFKKKFTFEVPFGSIIKDYIINIIISSISVITVLMTKNFMQFNNLITLIICGIETIIVYCGLTYLVNRKIISELKSL